MTTQAQQSKTRADRLRPARLEEVNNWLADPQQAKDVPFVESCRMVNEIEITQTPNGPQLAELKKKHIKDLTRDGGPSFVRESHKRPLRSLAAKIGAGFGPIVLL